MKKVFKVIVFSVLFCGVGVLASAQNNSFFQSENSAEPLNDDGSVNPPNPDANAPIGEGFLLTAAAAAVYGLVRRKKNAEKN